MAGNSKHKHPKNNIRESAICARPFPSMLMFEVKFINQFGDPLCYEPFTLLSLPIQEQTVIFDETKFVVCEIKLVLKASSPNNPKYQVVLRHYKPPLGDRS